MQAAQSPTKTCPFCAETIMQDAILCRFCHSSLDAAALKKAGSGTSRRFSRATLLAPLAVISLVLGAVSFASPYATVYALADAMRKNDSAALTKMVDFPPLRESMKVSLVRAMSESIAADPAAKANPLAPLGLMMGVAVINAAVDSLLTPAGLYALMDGALPSEVIQQPDSSSPDKTTTESNKQCTWTGSYESFDSFNVKLIRRDGTDSGSSFGLGRTGPFSWKLNRFTMK